jgi:ribulose-5-phosphate 4-epimerase/fuculose-1-phosphate aldolase
MAIESLIAFGRAAAQAGLLASTCGNASVRTDSAHIAISASGAALGSLDSSGIVVVRLEDGAVVSGARPSMELDLHLRAYRARPAVGAVLHGQSQAATALGCYADPPTRLDFIPEVPAYVRRHAYVPYAQPGTADLAASVEAALRDPEVTVVQMKNHGQVIVGATWEKVIRRAQFFELACFIALQRGPLETIPDPLAAELRGMARDV